MSARARRALAALVTVAALASGAGHAQGAAPLVEVVLGFRGVPVADAWNPVRLVLRDVGAGALRLTVDQGSLLEGELPWTVEVPFEGGGGVRVIEVDAYLPAWRSLRWTVDAGGLRLASGASARAAADRRPVDLVLSSRAGELLGDLAGRRVDVVASDLPSRAAAYGGVRSVWVDGSVPLPSPATLAAAAAGGAVVVVQGAARDEAPLAPLRAAADAAGGALASGAGGWWFGPRPTGADLTRARLDVAALATAFAATSGPELPAFVAPTWVAVAAIGYLLLVAIAWRLGGAVGFVTWAWVVGAAAALALAVARPPAPTSVALRELRLGVDGLALAQRAHDLFTFPAGPVAVAAVARPASPVAGTGVAGRDARTEVRLERWRGTTLLEAPRAATLTLAWGPDGRPRVVGDAPLHDVRVVGGGGWAVLAPGASPEPERDTAPLAGVEAAFEALLPTGSAWARSADAWHVLLPPDRLRAAEARP